MALAVRHSIAVLHLHHAIGNCAQQRANHALLLLLAPQKGIGDGEEHHRMHPAGSGTQAFRHGSGQRSSAPKRAVAMLSLPTQTLWQPGWRVHCAHLTLFSVGPTARVRGVGAICRS